ncbi:hypothetical protein PhCBS80983_g05547 [Powellomyces hirtus]|uniref:DNA/RNA-binding protein Alba-like domain-containing protein n=1 Tax=Powellomyces hirtus TaxID=109895 RepID=A0A507DTU6_9FUNG|nr:alba-domain-containing protein [Powellomyces hirtus]TPX55153.1 hypothetical protein PhCBS80983_g05547 [Powellomyces hirtus]
MEKYRRKVVGDEPAEPRQPNEIHIATHGKIRDYVRDVLNLLKDRQHEQVVIVGRGKAINKAVTVAEITKRRMDGKVKQEPSIYHVQATDVWEPVEDGLER